MKDLLLLPALLAFFAFGYYVMKRVDHFVEENQRLITMETRRCCCRIRIAAEIPALLDSAASALEACSNANPYMEFFFSSGKAGYLLQKLREETVDIALLTGEDMEKLQDQYAFIRIPRQETRNVTTALGLPVESPREEKWIYVVWNRWASSKDRDRVIFALENEYCKLKRGYCDYLD